FESWWAHFSELQLQNVNCRMRLRFRGAFFLRHKDS
ncbi:MAG: hypothetical protein JWL71_1610, partial [Acidobacteria bacterium]|nr:hypothetical protein [Acidobacteriota bacterium]